MEEKLIKQEFIRQSIEKDIRDIYHAQYMIASQRIYYVGRKREKEQWRGRVVKGRSGALMNALQNPKYSISMVGNGVIATNNIPLYLRFLDMPGHGDYQIYNRQVWGILYNNSWEHLRTGYTNDIKEKITVQLEEALK